MSHFLEAAKLAHQAFFASGPIGSDGFGWPELDDPLPVELTEESRPTLAAMGIAVTGPLGIGNRVIVDRRSRKFSISIIMSKGAGNTFIIEKDVAGKIVLKCFGNRNCFILRGCDAGGLNANIDCKTDAGGAYIGRSCTAGGVNLWIEHDRRIYIGEDAMFSWNVFLRTGEGHGIIDVTTRKAINRTADLLLGPHVWVGQDAIVNSGVTIGAGSIVGGRAIVTKSVPPQSLVVGAPAKLIRSGVTWSRTPRPSEAEIDRLLGQSYFTPDKPPVADDEADADGA